MHQFDFVQMFIQNTHCSIMLNRLRKIGHKVKIGHLVLVSLLAYQYKEGNTSKRLCRHQILICCCFMAIFEFSEQLLNESVVDLWSNFGNCLFNTVQCFLHMCMLALTVVCWTPNASELVLHSERYQ